MYHVFKLAPETGTTVLAGTVGTTVPYCGTYGRYLRYGHSYRQPIPDPELAKQKLRMRMRLWCVAV